MADESMTNLLIWAKDGTKVAYALNDLPKLTFVDNQLCIKTNNVEIKYDLEEMQRFTYETATTDITDLKSDEIFKYENEALIFPSLKANSTVSVCSVNGNVVFRKTVLAQGEYAFPLKNLNAGVYIVQVNGLTYKILIK